MARKRMLSPDIWESESFSSLSDLARLVFIGLISLSDDEGRGKANPSYIKSMLFPYDEGRRVADIKSALLEIARCMSVQFYSINGNDYYALTNWEKWQTINRPTKSKIPSPPMSGEGGTISKNEENEKLTEHSLNTHGVLTEHSRAKEVEVEEEVEKNSSSRIYIDSKDYKYLCDTIGKSDCDYYLERVQAFKEKNPTATFSVRATILKWHKEDKQREQATKGSGTTAPKVERTYSAETLNALFNDISYDEL